MSLSLEKSILLNLPYSRMDLLYWINIIELGENTDLIIENTDLKKFNQIFDEHSLFHYFASNPEVIEAICKQYRSEE